MDEEEYILIRKITMNLAKHLPYHIDREDLVQSAAFAVWQAKSNYDSTRGSYPTFCSIIIQRIIIDNTRKRLGRIETQYIRPTFYPLDVNIVDSQPITQDVADIVVGEQFVFYALTLLKSKRQYEAVYRCVILRESEVDVAKDTGKAHNTIDGHKHKGLKYLKTVLYLDEG